MNRLRPLVELQAATRTYLLGGQAVDAICNVDLTLQPGTFVSIVGPSGAGKSTLLHLVGGLDKPTSGSVVVADKNLSRLDDNELAAFRLRSGRSYFNPSICCLRCPPGKTSQFRGC